MQYFATTMYRFIFQHVLQGGLKPTITAGLNVAEVPGCYPLGVCGGGEAPRVPLHTAP